MSYIPIKKLPSAEELTQRYPLSSAGFARIMQDRMEIKQIIEGQDQRLLMIVGPCSAWPKDAVLAYAERLLSVSEAVKHTLKIVMRMYIQKPRTTKGWTGAVNQPDPFAAPDIEAGMYYARDMMVKVVEMGLPIADECLFTHNARGFSELVSWFAIGARSSEDHEHRIFASAADCAVGMKNPTHGSMAIAVNSVIAAQHSHVAAVDGYAIETFGNPHAHLVLRGSNHAPNYALEYLEDAKKRMNDHQIKYPAAVIDVSHDNCLVNGKKDPLIQPAIIFEVMRYLKSRPDLRAFMKGFMVESYLKSGRQAVEQCTPSTIDLQGLSITDPCLGFEQTESLLYELARSCYHES
jgi:3-deoxy-7-phosphoheptulonate synthase